MNLPLIEEVNAPYAIERSRHGGIALQRLAMWAEGSAWRQADSVIAVTTHLADIVAAAGVPRERVCVMSNGIDTAAFQAPRAAGAEQELGLGAFTVLGFTGFVREWNGLEAAIDLLVDPDLRGVFLLIIGDGPARASLEERARRLGVDARMRFTGLVERSQIPGLVSAVDVALQPAANPYASPLKLFEYMALGRAIVAPDQPNIREILTHDKDAVLFDPESRRSFQSAVRRLVADAHLRARLGAAAAVTLRERKLTWHHNAERVIALAERLVARRSASNGRAVEGR
jgi:glycosyltransferase involved in cell wall biosynthesis